MVDDIRRSYGQGWRHFFWVDDAKALPAATRMLAAEAPNVQVMPFRDCLPDGAWLRAVDGFLRDRKFPFAVDILRMKVLQEFGGLYCDLGVIFNQAIDFLVERFDYAFIFWENLFFQNSLMMMPPQCPLADTFMHVVEDPYSVPQQLVQPLTAESEGHLFAGPMLTALMFGSLADDARVCPLAPNHGLVSWWAQQSWSQETEDALGKFGNAYVPKSLPSLLDGNGWIGRGDSVFDSRLFVMKRGRA
jgi:hypothetical protein